jgi:hypothetical protein
METATKTKEIKRILKLSRKLDRIATKMNSSFSNFQQEEIIDSILKEINQKPSPKLKLL